MRLQCPSTPFTTRMAMLFLFFLHSLTGCASTTQLTQASIWDFPVTSVDYAPKDKINLQVELRLSEELHNAAWEGRWATQVERARIPLGKDLAGNAERLARTVFANVQVTAHTVEPAIAGVDAILTPTFVSVQQDFPVFTFQTQTTTGALEWSFQDTQGNVIWEETITGEGKGPRQVSFSTKKGTQAQFEAMIKDLFQKSYQRISATDAIRAFASRR